MHRISAIGLFTILAVLFGSTSRVSAQTGPDVGQIRRDFERAEEAKKRERDAAMIRQDAKERAEAATRPSVERVKQLEAEVAARPTMSEVETLRAENAKLRADLEQSRASTAALAAERDGLRKRLDEIRAAAAGK